MKKKLKIPTFKNDDDEFNFWSTLDLSDYFEPQDFNQIDIDEFLVENQKTRTRSITMRLPEKLIEKVKQQASSLDVPYQSLMKIYIQKGAEI